MTDDAHQPERTFERVDLTGARFEEVHLNGATFRMVDLSGVIMRDISLANAAIDGGDLDGFTINGVEVAPLIEAELVRRQPVRALRRASDPADLRSAWAMLGRSWDVSTERVRAMPPGTVDLSVADEWSYAQTLRHLVFATDAWLGSALGNDPRYHPWGEPFTGMAEFVEDPASFGLDLQARPTFNDILALRAERMAQVAQLLESATAESLAEACAGPPWAGDRTTLLRCVHVVLDEECEHLRFAERDLDQIEAGSPLVRAQSAT